MEKCNKCTRKKGHWIFGVFDGGRRSGLALIDYDAQSDTSKANLNPKKCFDHVDEMNEITKVSRPNGSCPFFMDVENQNVEGKSDGSGQNN